MTSAGGPSARERKFIILRAGSGDADLARQAVAEVHGRTPVDEAALIEFLREPHNYLLLALDGPRVVGSLSGYALQHPHRREPQFLLYEIDVLPDWRNRGIGKALVDKFLAEARDEGAFEVWVLTNQSNQAAMKLYASCGFHRKNQDDAMLSVLLIAR